MPRSDVHETRRRARSGLRVDWREFGLLKLSGYAVGKKSELTPLQRRAVLNFVFLEDDLSDLEDAEYARQWGRPRSTKRLQKMAESLSAFARTARNRDDEADFSVAIAHWESDLTYLQETFGPRVRPFSWPSSR